jgi:hypothetical protein
VGISGRMRTSIGQRLWRLGRRGRKCEMSTWKNTSIMQFSSSMGLFRLEADGLQLDTSTIELPPDSNIYSTANRRN